MSDYFEPILAKYECGLWKSYSAQNGVLAMVEIWKKCLNKKGTGGALLTDLT